MSDNNHSNNNFVRQGSSLRARLNRFLTNHSKKKKPLRAALDRLEEHSWAGVIFGGVLRDLAVFGNSFAPRDVDVVVSGANALELERAYDDIVHHKNRFGGLQLRPKDWLIDIWALQDSWAFKKKLAHPINFDQLVKTTFLNVEAVAVEVASKPGSAREIYSSGFFEAIAGKILDINFEPNPFPQLCVVRTLISALRLNFGISPRLGKYLIRNTHGLPVRELVELQESHYSKVRIESNKMVEYLTYIEEQLCLNSSHAIWLPTTRQEQLELSQSWSPSH